MTKTARGITIDDDLWEKIKKLAKKENRPISNFIETVLIKHIEDTKQTEKP